MSRNTIFVLLVVLVALLAGCSIPAQHTTVIVQNGIDPYLKVYIQPGIHKYETYGENGRLTYVYSAADIGEVKGENLYDFFQSSSARYKYDGATIILINEEENERGEIIIDLALRTPGDGDR